MKSLYSNNIKIILPNKDGDERYFITMSIDDIEATPPIHRKSIKVADLETKIPFMPRDISSQFTSWIGNVLEGLFIKDKI